MYRSRIHLPRWLLATCVALAPACIGDYSDHTPDDAGSAADATVSAPPDSAAGSTGDGGSGQNGAVVDAARGAEDAAPRVPEASASDGNGTDTGAVTPEAGPQVMVDSSTVDSSTVDVSIVDASPADTGAVDAAPVDSGAPDAATGVCGAQLSCGGAGCAPRSFGFEDGSLSGAYLYTSVSMGVVTPITSTRAQVHGGSRALSLGMRVEGTLGYFIVEIPLCTRPQTTPQAGATLSGYLYFDGPALPMDTDVSMHWSAPGFYGDAAVGRNVMPKQWTHLSGPVPADNSDLFGIGITVTFRAPWTGTIYFDDLSVQ